MSDPIRIIAWGNRGRRDDGVALALAERLEQRFAADSVTDVIVHQHHQLGPEVVCDLDRCRLAIFVDADVRPDHRAVSIEPVTPVESRGLNTHHCRPSELLALAAGIGMRAPRSLLVCIPAHDLAFGDGLSDATSAAMAEAESHIIRIVEEASSLVSRDCHA